MSDILRDSAPPRKAARPETPPVAEEQRRAQEPATGSESVGFTGIQERLKAVLSRLAQRGLSVVGAEGLLMQRPDGMTSAELAQLAASADAAVRDGESKELLPAAAELLRGGQDMASALTGASYFNGLDHGLGVLSGGPMTGHDRGKGGRGAV